MTDRFAIDTYNKLFIPRMGYVMISRRQIEEIIAAAIIVDVIILNMSNYIKGGGELYWQMSFS